MKNYITWLIISILAVSLATSAGGQSIEETLKDLVSTNAQSYLGPFATAFGTGMNSGTYRTAKPHKILGFDVTINLSMTTVPDAALTYDFYIPDEVNLPMDIEGTKYNIPLSGALLYPGEDRTSSTFFGKNSSYTIVPDGDYAAGIVSNKLINEHGFAPNAVELLENEIANTINNNLTIYTPKGLDFSSRPVPMPQLSVGLPFNTELTLRGFTLPLGESDEKLSFKGFGLKIGVNQFIPTIPLVFPALSVGY